jgi:myo-inositol-1(or 4)-monophosphatase
MFPAIERILQPIELDRFASACETAARLGGAVLSECFGKVAPQRKGAGDWVSHADIEAQRVIRTYLLEQFPQHGFLGEERSVESETAAGNEVPEFCWIVDPLDGTVNFLHQLRSFSVSVALAIRDPATGARQVVTGVVLDPILDEYYSASLRKGAFLNGNRIQVSQCTRLPEALTVFSTNTALPATDPQIRRMLNVMATPASMRRLGSAALNLCYIACGRVDAYWAANLSCWDIAAGWLIATEAGAKLEDLDGAELDIMRPKFCCAATQSLMDELRPLLRV